MIIIDDEAVSGTLTSGWFSNVIWCDNASSVILNVITSLLRMYPSGAEISSTKYVPFAKFVNTCGSVVVVNLVISLPDASFNTNVAPASVLPVDASVFMILTTLCLGVFFTLISISLFVSEIVNLYGSLLTSLSNQIKKGHSYDEMDYSFTINDTHIDEYSESYECELNYYTYTESADFGSVEEIYMMEFGFTFVNGKIKRSRVVQQYMFGIQGEVQSVIENNIYTTYETVDEYQDFDGIRFNPEDFQYKKTALIR